VSLLPSLLLLVLVVLLVVVSRLSVVWFFG
jgi:hypothetical protein